jgi:SAM-dependent methyltransferase
LSREPVRRTSATVPAELFDRHLRAIRRDRAARVGPELFLFDRAFDECLDRVRDIARTFDRAMLLGCPSAEWPARLASIADKVDVLDPGTLFAGTSGGAPIEEDRYDFGVGRYDLCVAIGTLDTVNDLQAALGCIHRALKPDAPFIGAIAGGDSLPALRVSLIEAGRHQARIAARFHPRIEPSTLAQLLAAAGFNMPVVDVDRVRLRYTDLDGLVRDLRSMAATSVLAARSPPMTRSELEGARRAFRGLGDGHRTEETVEILHFLGWTKYSRKAAN